jgi:hypothetical protein
MRSLTVSLISGALLVSLAGPSQAQSPVTDLGSLSLRVAESTVVPELPLSGSLSGPQFQVRPEKGMKLVAVTLKGDLKAPGQYVVWPQLFAVLFEEEQAPSGRRTVKVAGAHHVASEPVLGDGLRWAANYATTATRPGPVTIKFAVTIPEAVQNFQVLYATAISGSVKLGGK